MRILLLLVFSLYILSDIYSQDSLVDYHKRGFSGKRPKIGLVLSGGGAKGTAHVGVLRVLDSLGIHPDYITGTSMGSIVGGLYSIGYTTDMLEEMVNSTEWSKYLSNNSQFKTINMIEKESYKNYFEFPVYDWKPNLPQGAIKGQEIELLFNELTISVAKDTSFDDFHIPFRAVAVDILTGKPYVFKSGSLALAMRSSMSIPSVMDPIKYKGMLLVDGGLVENFPVKECIDMGADIIIGVYTGAELLPEEKLNSMINVLKQSSFVASIKNANDSRKLVDLYIEPYLSDRDAANFDDVVPNMDRGYEAAMSNIDNLVKLKAYIDKFPQATIDTVIFKDSVYVSNHSILFDNNDSTLENIIVNNYGHLDGEYTHSDQIVESIHYLYGTRLFNKLTYAYSQDPQGTGVVLDYNVINTNNRTFLLSLNYKTETKVGVNVGFRLRNFLIPGSRFEAKFRLSENPGVKVQAFTYLNKNVKHGFDATYYYRTSKIPFYNDKELIGEYSSHFHRWSTGYHYFAKTYSDLYLGVGHERIYYNRIIDLSTFSYPKIVNISTYFNLYFQQNTLDKKYFANKGTDWKVETRVYLRNDSKYYMPKDTLIKYPNMKEYESYKTVGNINISFEYKNFIPINKKLVFINEFNAFAGTGYLYSTWVGGVNTEEEYQIPFWGFAENSIMANNGAFYRIGLRYEFIKKFYITGKANLGFIAEDVFDILESTDDFYGQYSSIYNVNNYIIGGGLKLSYNSLLGPISVSVTKGSRTSGVWWHFMLGYNF